MGLTKKSDGRYVVGKGIADGNEYKGSAAWRDMVIQYSGDGATEKSLEYLTFLKDYALYHSAQGNPVIPPNVQIWMSTANTMKAVEADDITVDGETVKIGACTWDGSDWSFAEPTPGGGGMKVYSAEFDVTHATSSMVPLLLYDDNENPVDISSISGACYITTGQESYPGYGALNAIFAVQPQYGAGTGFGVWSTNFAATHLVMVNGTVIVALPQ